MITAESLAGLAIIDTTDPGFRQQFWPDSELRVKLEVVLVSLGTDGLADAVALGARGSLSGRIADTSLMRCTLVSD
jgi:hypothetical protein